MKEISVSGQKRATTGKKASKEMRKEGLVPCNLYGEKKGENGAPEAMSFAIPASQLRRVVYSPDVYVVNITIDGEAHKAVMKALWSYACSLRHCRRCNKGTCHLCEMRKSGLRQPSYRAE